MTTQYQLVIQDTMGGSIDTFDRMISLDYARKFNTKGFLTVVIPDIIEPGYLNRDYRILVYRSVDGRPPYLDMDTFWLIRTIEYNSNDKTWSIRADDVLSILDRRIVAYRGGTTAYADKTYELLGGTLLKADDMIKAYVRENIGNLTLDFVTGASPDPARDLVTPGYLEIEADTSEGPEVEKEASWQNLLETCQDIARMSAKYGTDLYFDMIVRGDNSILFKTWTDVRGINRGPSSASPLLFYPDYNLENLSLKWDYSEEIGYIYAGGEDTAGERLIVQGSDDNRISLSPWNRNESFLDLGDHGNEDVMDDEIASALQGSRGRLLVTGEPIEDTGTQYGVDYFYGDLVQVSVLGYNFNSAIDSVNVSVGESGENVRVQLSGELEL